MKGSHFKRFKKRIRHLRGRKRISQVLNLGLGQIFSEINHVKSRFIGSRLNF